MYASTGPSGDGTGAGHQAIESIATRSWMAKDTAARRAASASVPDCDHSSAGVRASAASPASADALPNGFIMSVISLELGRPAVCEHPAELGSGGGERPAAVWVGVGHHAVHDLLDDHGVTAGPAVGEPG